MAATSLDQVLSQRKRFVAFVRRRVSDEGRAEDIVQTAYLRALEHVDDFASEESAVAWFYRLLRNAIVDTYRRQASQDKALAAWTRELETITQLSPELDGEVCACLRGIVDGLKPEYAEILRAVDLGEQRVQEYAHQHGLSTSNAGVRIHRARAALKKQLLLTCGACAEHACLDCTCRQHAHEAAGSDQRN